MHRFLNLCAIYYLLTNVSVGYVSCYAKLLPRVSLLMQHSLARVLAIVNYDGDTKLITDICCASYSK